MNISTSWDVHQGTIHGIGMHRPMLGRTKDSESSHRCVVQLDVSDVAMRCQHLPGKTMEDQRTKDDPAEKFVIEIPREFRGRDHGVRRIQRNLEEMYPALHFDRVIFWRSLKMEFSPVMHSK